MPWMFSWNTLMQGRRILGIHRNQGLKMHWLLVHLCNQRASEYSISLVLLFSSKSCNVWQQGPIFYISCHSPQGIFGLLVVYFVTFCFSLIALYYFSFGFKILLLLVLINVIVLSEIMLVFKAKGLWLFPLLQRLKGFNILLCCASVLILLTGWMLLLE